MTTATTTTLHHHQPPSAVICRDVWWLISRFATHPKTLRLICHTLRALSTDRVFLPRLPLGAPPIMHQNREKIGLLRGIAVRPTRKMMPLVDLLKAGGGGKNVNDVVDGDRHTCAVLDFGVCCGPVYDSGVCKHLLSHVTRMVHTGKAKKRLFQLHIVNA